MMSKVANDNGSGRIMYLSQGMEAGLKILCSFHNPGRQSQVATCA